MPANIALPSYLQWSVTGFPPFQTLTDATMPAGTLPRWLGDVGSTCISGPIDCRYLDNISIEVTFTGTPTGTMQFQGSNDMQPNPNNIMGGSPIYQGTWTNLTPAPTSPTGSGITVLGNFTGIAFAFLRVNYAPTSGSGKVWANWAGSKL